MGFERLAKQSNTQLQRLIHTIACDTANVVVTRHAQQQMAKRKISSPSLFKCLREGLVARQPEQNHKLGTLECRIERLCGGQMIGVIVAVSDEDPTLVVVTAMLVGRR
jgi:hypothetical protein